MEGVGTNVILVGFPEGVHLAFSGSMGSPALLWKGRFYDAYRTWFSRFPEFEKPLGSDIIHWPVSDMAETARYGGYRLDSAGIPEFVLILKGAEMFERYIPVSGDGKRTGLQRTIRYTQERQLNDPRLSHPETANVTEVEDNNPMTRTFIYQW